MKRLFFVLFLSGILITTNQIYAQSRFAEKICVPGKRIGNVNIETSDLREIGAKQPRFAIALAFLKENNILGMDEQKVYLLPIELNQEVFAKWLDLTISGKQSRTAQNLFEDAQLKAAQLPAPVKNAEPVVYSVNVINSGETNKIIRLEVVKGFPSDPAYSSLDLIVEETPLSSELQRDWRVRNWEIR